MAPPTAAPGARPRTGRHPLAVPRQPDGPDASRACGDVPHTRSPTPRATWGRRFGNGNMRGRVSPWAERVIPPVHSRGCGWPPSPRGRAAHGHLFRVPSHRVHKRVDVDVDADDTRGSTRVNPGGILYYFDGAGVKHDLRGSVCSLRGTGRGGSGISPFSPDSTTSGYSTGVNLKWVHSAPGIDDDRNCRYSSPEIVGGPTWTTPSFGVCLGRRSNSCVQQGPIITRLLRAALELGAAPFWGLPGAIARFGGCKNSSALRESCHYMVPSK